MKLPALLLLCLVSTAAAPTPEALEQLAKMPTAPNPRGEVPGRFTLVPFGGKLYRLDTATGQTWELTIEPLPNNNTLVGWAGVVESVNVVKLLLNSK
jgi:hypothetical protein